MVEAAAFNTALAKAREAWPAIDIEPRLFAEHVEAIGGSLDDLHCTDLYLACACSHGDAAAIGIFEERYVASVPGYLRHMKLETSLIEEAQQTLREKLLVAPAGERPRIAAYLGHAPLAAWLRVTAVNTTLKLLRKSGNAERAVESPSFMTPSSPELDYMRLEYRDAFEAAFHDALAKLTARERNVLRLYFVDELTAEAIGAIYRVNRSTITRWMSAARAQLLANVRTALRSRLSPTDWNSVVALVGSQLEITLSALVAAGNG